jgi:tetratricopeptide (TPR) repeat protein
VQATFAMLLLLMTMAPASGDDLLAHGRKELRTGQYAEAVKDLGGAADAFLTPQQTAAYIRTGHHDALADYETALVYLTVTYAKLGRADDARATLRRINAAEQIEPTYQALPLDADAAEFESIAQKLLPEMPLPPNQALAEIHGGKRHRAEVA